MGTRNFVAYVVGRRFQVDRQFKLYRDTATSLTADAAQRTNAGNTVDILFERLRNLVHDYFGIGSRIGYVDRMIGLSTLGNSRTPKNL